MCTKMSHNASCHPEKLELLNTIIVYTTIFILFLFFKPQEDFDLFDPCTVIMQACRS